MSKDTIKALIDEYLTLEQSEKNQKRKAKWKYNMPIGRDQIRLTPKTDGSWRTEGAPFAADMQNQYWIQLLDFDLVEYYHNPECWLENYLKMKMKHFEMFDDDVFLDKNLLMCGGAIFEGSLYGMGYSYWPDNDPQLAYAQRLIETPEDLKKMPKVDFYKSGIMDQTLRWYEGVRDLCGDQLNVCFPEYLRGCFGVGTYLCGLENLLVIMMDEPEFAHDIFNYIDEVRNDWFDAYYKYLGVAPRQTAIFNDEIAEPMLSPELYSEFILPHEQAACKKHGGLAYWHSCGNVTHISRAIAEIDEIEMMNVSAWCNQDPVVEVFAKKSALEICINHLPDIFNVKDMNQVDEQIKGMYRMCDKHDANGWTIRAAGIAASRDVNWVTDRVQDWCYHVRKATEESIG